MDLDMPEMNGFEAARSIRADATIAAQPQIIAITAAATREARDATFEAGMDDYITKPVTLTVLRAALERARTRRQERSLPLA
jgi:CheY-like chemotaxis protein